MKKTIFFLILLSTNVNAQNIETNKNPKKAAIYSAIIPGAGQVYTKKYWKTPIIYAGIVTASYFISDNQEKYTLYKTTALNRINGDYSDHMTYTDSELIILKDYYRRNRDLSIFGLIGVYIINIIDASINAHLFHYDISDDISLNVQPKVYTKQAELCLILNF